MFNKLFLGICMCVISTPVFAADSTSLNPLAIYVVPSDGDMQCVTKYWVGAISEGTLWCDAGYTLTGGGCTIHNRSKDTIYYSRANGNGWYCSRIHGGVRAISIRCCKQFAKNFVKTRGLIVGVNNVRRICFEADNRYYLDFKRRI